jgi:TP901 family phage tail tape measure protein
MVYGEGSTGGASIGTGITFTLEDGFSRVAETIKHGWHELEDTTREASHKIEESMEELKHMAFGIGIYTMLIEPLYEGVSALIKMDDTLIGVARTTHLSKTEVQGLKEEIEEIDTRTSVEQLLKVAAVAGQLGFRGKHDIADFTDEMDKVNLSIGEQFQGGAGEMVTTLGKISRTFYGTSENTKELQENMMHIGNAMTVLSQNGLATADQMSAFSSKIGGTAIPLGATQGQILGLSATLQELGIDSGRGAFAMQSVIMKMANDVEDFSKLAGMSATDFKDLLNKDVMGALSKVVEGSKKFGSSTDLANTLDALGLEGRGTAEVFLKLGANTDMLREKTTLATAALTGNSAVLEAAAAKNETIGALIAKAGESMEEVGMALTPAIKPIVELFALLAHGLNVIVHSGFGQALILFTVTTYALKNAMGGLSLITAMAEGVMTLFAIGAEEAAIAEASATFATEGLTAGFAAMWTVLAPAIPILLGIAAVVLLLFGAYKLVTHSVESFTKVMEGTEEVGEGWTLMFQRIGGVIEGCIEIFKSANSETFSMSEGMRAALDKLGILDFVVDLGLWIARIKLFFEGLWDGFKMIMVPIKNAILWMVDGLGKLAAAFGFDIGKNLSDIHAWIIAGKILGVLIAITLIPTMIFLAISVIMATWPFLLFVAIVWLLYEGIMWLINGLKEGSIWAEIIGVILAIAFLPLTIVIATIALVVYAIYELIEGCIYVYDNWSTIWQAVKDVFSSFYGGIVQTISDIKDLFISLIEWFEELPDKFYNWGTSIVHSIMDGIMDSWAWLKSQFIDLISDLPGGKYVLQAFGVDDSTLDKSPVNTSSMTNADGVSSIGAMVGDARADSISSSSSYTETKNSKEILKSVTLNIDGKDLRTTLNQMDQTEESRD